MKNILIVLSVALSLGLSACSRQESAQAGEQESAAAASAQAAPAAGAAQPAAAAAQVASPESFNGQGRVEEVIQVQGYTYLEVENNGQRIWVASSPSKVEKGDVVHWADYALMRNFHSKALNRDFPALLFVSQVTTGEAPAQAAAAAPTGGAPSNGGTVVSLQNAAGYTYIEVDNGGAHTWLAAPESQLSVGDKVTWSDGAPMSQFTSKALNRTFDTILFVSAVQVVQ